MPLHAPKLRTDLIVREDPERPGRYFVKDPVRGQYAVYNELHVAVMQALDGKRTLQDVQEHLGETLAVEVPLGVIEQFVDRLQRSWLLDVTSYTAADARTRKAILAALRKRKLALRVEARDEACSEAMLLAAGTRQLHAGDPCLAASYFAAVLEVNPHNDHARRVLACIQEAFLRSKIVAPSHLRTWKLLNPDRFLSALDRRVGRTLFRPAGVTAILLLLLSAVYAAVDVLQRPGAFQGVSLGTFWLVALVFVAHALVHEMSHGLACKHYGGRVEEVGILLMYGVMPGAYCDTSDSYVFTRTRHRIIVQLAGTLGHMMLQALMWHLLALTDPGMPLWQPLLLVNLYSLWQNWENLIPLVPRDGYYALAELLHLPNLRARAFTHLSRASAETFLGVTPEAPAPAPRERRIFVVYAIAAGVYTASMIYFVFISYLLPLAIEHLGTIGLLLTIAYFVKIVALTLAARAIRLVRFVLARRDVVFTRRRTLAFSGAALAMAFVLGLPWPLHVEGRMELEPRERASVRALEGGLVDAITVREGAHVVAGQLLAVLHSEELVRDRAVAAEDLAVARATLAMRRRGARPETLALARAQTAVEQARSAAATERLQYQQQLGELWLESAASVHLAAASASQAAGMARVRYQDEALVRAGTREEELAASEANVRRLEAQLASIELKLRKLELRSPVTGVAVLGHVEDLLGRRLNAGDELMQVHDVSSWRVRVVPDSGEALQPLAQGQAIAVAARGDAGHVCRGTITELLPPPDPREPVVVYATMPGSERWRSGMTGTARIYVPPRSVAYRLIALPLIRLVDFDLRRMR